jgi:hypothetical protein
MSYISVSHITLYVAYAKRRYAGEAGREVQLYQGVAPFTGVIYDVNDAFVARIPTNLIGS